MSALTRRTVIRLRRCAALVLVANFALLAPPARGRRPTGRPFRGPDGGGGERAPLAFLPAPHSASAWEREGGGGESRSDGRPPRRGRRSDARGALAASPSSIPMEVWLDARRSGGKEEGEEVGAGGAFSEWSSEAARRVAAADAVVVRSSPVGSPPPVVLPPGAEAEVYAHREDKLVKWVNGGDGPGEVVGASVRLSDASGQDAALALIGSVGWILCDTDDDDEGYGGGSSSGDDAPWRMIPAENLISASRGTGTRVAVSVDRPGDVVGLARALELGVDALCVDVDVAEELWGSVLEAREERRENVGRTSSGTEEEEEGPSIATGSCRRLDTSGGKGTVLADRVCVDLVRSLTPNEGCWVGSSAKLTALVLSEAAASSYVPSRPFRVNAGPVHSYIVLGDGKTTKYLSELRTGDEVLVHDVQSGKDRSVAVGRLKTEVRPCVMVGLSIDGKEHPPDGQVFLQQAETVRLGQREGDDSFVRVTDLSKGAQEDVLLRVASAGTHVGKAYSGKVTEK